MLIRKISFIITFSLLFPKYSVCETIKDTFRYYDYAVVAELPSLIDPSKIQVYEVGLKCPGSEDHIEPLEDNETDVCPNGLKVTKRVNPWDTYLDCELEI